MERVFLAESAILIHLQPVRRVLFVFLGVVVALLAFRVSECDFDSHFGTSVTKRFRTAFFIAYLRNQGTKKEPS